MNSTFGFARINEQKIADIAKIMQSLPSGNGLNFYSFTINGKETPDEKSYPSLHHPATLDFFLFACMHQYGFWYGNQTGYEGPLFGTMHGKERKGSDLLWMATKRALDNNPEIFNPSHLANLTYKEFIGIMSDDKGPIPFTDLGQRYKLTKAMGAYLSSARLGLAEIINRANNSASPLETFLNYTKAVPGYDKDPLLKKNTLLAMAVANRPERYLDATDSDHWQPIIDYHLMRIALRQGLVEITNDVENNRNSKRAWTTEHREYDIRVATYYAINELIEQSGKPMTFVDEQLWMARKYCPEMTEPDCGKCVFNDGCEKRTNLFQPVYETTAY